MKLGTSRTIEVPADRVVGVQLRAVVFTAVELYAARRLTGARRLLLGVVIGHNVVQFVRVGRAVARHLEQQRGG